MILVFGAGAVGGCIAAHLALAGANVALFARGAALDAIRDGGLRLRRGAEEQAVPIRVACAPGELGAPRVLIVCSKAYGMPAAAPTLAALMGPQTVLVPVQNGIPWWYFHAAGGPFDGLPVPAVDPHGALLRALPPARVVGCVVYLAAAVVRPGLIELSAPGRLVLGEPDGSSSARLAWIGDALRRGGLTVELTDRIRDAIWMKLWGNLAFNPVSALTLADVRAMVEDADLRRVLARMMEEARGVARGLGVYLDVDIEQRIEQARWLGAFKTSMLQDLQAGRPLEIDALIGAVSALGGRLGVPTPTVDMVESLLRMRAAPGACP